MFDAILVEDIKKSLAFKDDMCTICTASHNKDRKECKDYEHSKYKNDCTHLRFEFMCTQMSIKP